jgi:hypothetical protein
MRRVLMKRTLDARTRFVKPNAFHKSGDGGDGGGGGDTLENKTQISQRRARSLVALSTHRFSTSGLR